MRPLKIAFSMAAADADGICLSQTPAAGGVQSLTINGVLAAGGVATMDVARRVSITSAGNDSGRTFTVTGTDRYGKTQTEAITGPNTTTVIGAKDFKTVTSITIDDNSAGAITVGSGDEAATAWIPLDLYRSPVNVSFAVALSAGASLTYTVQHTLDNPFDGSAMVALNHATIAAKTVAGDGGYAMPITAIRLFVENFVSGTATFSVAQSGLVD